MTMFNPVAVARQIITTTDLADPEQIADAVLDRTPADQLRDVYRAVLRTVAREAIRLENMATSAPAAAPVAAKRSSRVAAIRQAHLSYFDQRVFAGGAWKLLGDCTVADVLDLAEQRRSIAAANASKADEFERLAERMQASGVRVARDLGEAAA